MRPVALVTPTLFPADVDDHRAIRKALRMPKSRDYVGLVASARGFAEAAEPYAERFTAAGLPKDHLQRLRDGADELRTIVDGRGQDNGKRAASTGGAVSEGKRGFALVRLINSLLQPSLRSDPARLAEWRQTIRLRRPAGASVGDAPTSDAPVTELKLGDQAAVGHKAA